MVLNFPPMEEMDEDNAGYAMAGAGLSMGLAGGLVGIGLGML